MNNQTARRSYTAELKESAKAIAPSQKQCDRILQAVLGAVDEKKITYQDAANQVERMSAFRVVHGIKDAVASRAGVAVVAAGLLLAVSLTQLLSGQTTIISNTPVPLTQGIPGITASYTVDSTRPISIVVGSDVDIPFMENYLVESDWISVYFSDEGSGVDWSSITAVDPLGNQVEPIEVDSVGGMVRFTLPEEDLILYVDDLAGNRAQSAIHVSA